MYRTTNFADPNFLLALTYAIIIVITFSIFWHRRRFYKLARKYPGPLELPFIGVFHRVSKPSDILPKLKVVLEIYETPTIFTFFGPQPGLYTTDPVLLEKVFTSAELFNKPPILYAPLSNLFGDGLFSSAKDKWHQHRKLSNPAFRLPVLRSFLPILNRNSKQFQQKLATQVGQEGGINMNELLQKVTLTAAMETILGYKIPEGTEVDNSIVEHYTSVMKSTLTMILLNVIKLGGVAKHLNFYKSREAVFKFVDKLLFERMKVIQGDKNNNNFAKPLKDDDDELYMNDNRRIFIDQAFKQYENRAFNWQDVIDESNSIIFAAFETTATALYFTVTFLAMHPEYQNKLFDEIVSIFPDKEDLTVDLEQLKECTYLDMVFNESLRLAPSVPTIARAVVEDTKLMDDLILPKDLLIIINIYQVHRSVEHWGDDANKFNPDHFLPENVKQRHPYSFLPFSKGLRNCIGGRYALIAAKIVIIHLLRNYRVSTDFKFEDLEFINYITLKVKEYPLLKIHPREK